MNDSPPSAEPQDRPATGVHRAWSLYIGRIGGIPIYLHFTFLLLMAYVVLARVTWGERIFGGPLFVAAIFACVVLHELGHAMMALYFGIRTEDIVLYPIGGVARLRSMGRGWQEFWIALAGPAVNLVIAVVLALVLVWIDYPWLNPDAIDQPRTGDQPIALPFWLAVLMVNLALLLFNLIPAFPMDGGRVLRSVLTNMMPRDRATAIAARIGQMFAILFMLLGIWDPLLLIIGLFVFLAAGQEAAATRSISLMSGRRVRDAMITRFEVLSHGDTLARAAELLLATNQHDFPVLGGGETIGLLERRALIQGLATLGRDHFVAEAMTREFPRLSPDDELERALEALRVSPGLPALVFDAGRLVGYINQENLAEYLMIAQARQSAS